MRLSWRNGRSWQALLGLAVVGGAMALYIVLSTPPSPPLAQAGEAPPTLEHPQPLMVPPGLAAITSMEPSGLVWVPERDRYLLVSDDTTKGRAWVFTMDRKGRLDPMPLAIEGVDKVSDLEAVTRGDGGEIYLLASQSVSRKGKRPAARELFIRAVWGATGLMVTGKVHLLEALVRAAGAGGSSQAWLASLGLGPQVKGLVKAGPDGTGLVLDIEGMAYWRGDIYLGLKEPLDSQGRALIWRIKGVEDLFARGALDPGNISLFARVALPLGGLASGISDLAFRPDGVLGLLSTLLDGTGGGLWLVDGAGQPPRLIRALPGRKPEGLAFSQGEAIVVFDEGQRPGLWAPWVW